MTTEQELDNKYFILKGEDIGNFLTKDEMFQLHDLSMKISDGRKATGKHDNGYIVLNLEDPIDLSSESPLLERIKELDDGNIYTVADIAWSIINAIRNKKNWTFIHGKT